MSVNTGTPTSRFTRARIFRPSVSPGPRKLSLLERFALSKLALKMYVMPSLSQIVFTCFATVRHSSGDSITHGPAITKRDAGLNRGSGMVGSHRDDKGKANRQQLAVQRGVAGGFAVDLHG